MPSPILYLPFKVPVRYDLVQPLANWLDDDESQVGFNNRSSSYSHSHSHTEVDAAPAMTIPKPAYNSIQCRSELLRIAALRNCMSEALQDSHKSALEEHEMLRDCQDYHATLLEFEKRGFPTGGGGDADEENGINLTWKGGFSDDDGSQKAGGIGVTETHHTLLWDRACTLWNIAALRSAAAALDTDDKTKEGLKSAISHLQQAASHLSLCRQILEHSRENEYISTVDLSKPMLQFWEKMLLAQAQTCIYKMANLEGSSVRNHTTLAFLIQGAAPLYNEALTLAQDPRLQSELPTRCQEWAAHCKAQSLVCQARAYFHMSIEMRLSKTHGREIGRLRQAVAALNTVLDFCKSTQILKEAASLFNKESAKNSRGGTTIGPIAEAAASIQPEVEGLLRLASDRLKAAEEDNRTVYLEDVPNPRNLQEIRSQTLVKTDLPLPEAMLRSRANLFGWE
uniref:BRO1 domain-containing protein n=1 Tax=Pseudo-nitzschia australis TaxID=44445 RepID=A0A7S4AU68_9STRA|mmetsp:Transcript_7391/g.15844  ORF Transcript_7391/g.15844 Transcript_7391/m.15844 type:complete len:453 (-) Transcript_7391:141-1499(-)|eukprot:CAMPEP_0168212630 /NCGR_PEP_ID=MMETSP0140_2-20121125/4370_1 /TAXON_ID=44445 /ORGANISM="Pseudo-nitzschia australis, Strain 10249 10 AB" /LENGTH=452 /DNA_ID=CAMNT_0008139439 /DNA_START=19 /DNA_END=1377 /DNA_ORIENTATION=-